MDKQRIYDSLFVAVKKNFKPQSLVLPLNHFTRSAKKNKLQAAQEKILQNSSVASRFQWQNFKDQFWPDA